MNYKNASHVLPDELLKEVQKYAAGETLYIPIMEEKQKWGSGSGARAYYRQRNEAIRRDYEKHKSMEELADDYGLTVESIRKIVYQK
ncbi:hypothetical protein lbkm_1331 [Lachnospiraceae bacterium KM106-2]|nr:hypothetical protein lbkm_1331 [Lachnospiraceae bacterium KM106-2]